MKSLVKPKKNTSFRPKPLQKQLIHNHSTIIKTFYISIVGKPELVEWIKLKKPSEQLSPDDILTTEEINALLEAADGEYWKALISFLWDCWMQEFPKLCHCAGATLSSRWTALRQPYQIIKTRAASRPMILPVCKNYMMNLKTFSGGKPDDFIFNKDYRFMARHILTYKRKSCCRPVSH